MTPLPTEILPCNTLAILGVALGDDGGGATNINANALYKARTQKDQRKELPSAPSLLDPSLPRRKLIEFARPSPVRQQKIDHSLDGEDTERHIPLAGRHLNLSMSPFLSLSIWNGL